MPLLHFSLYSYTRQKKISGKNTVVTIKNFIWQRISPLWQAPINYLIAEDFVQIEGLYSVLHTNYCYLRRKLLRLKLLHKHIIVFNAKF